MKGTLCITVLTSKNILGTTDTFITCTLIYWEYTIRGCLNMVIIRISEIYTSEMGVSAVWCGCGAWGSFKASRSNIWREERCWCIIPSGKGTRLQSASFEVGKLCITQNKPCTRLLRSPLCLPYRLQNILINHLLLTN